MISVVAGSILFFGFVIYILSGGSTQNLQNIITGKNEFKLIDSEDELVQTRFLNKTSKDLDDATVMAKKAQDDVANLMRKIDSLTNTIQTQTKSQKKELDLLKKELEQKQKNNTFSQTKGVSNSPNFNGIFKNAPLPNSTKAKELKPAPVDIGYEYEELEKSIIISAPSPKKKSITKKNKVAQSNGMPDNAFYIPAGAITVAYLDQGYDAPTLNSGNGMPVPSTMTVVGYTILPNNRLYDLRGCRILAESIGKRSNERAYMRLKRLTCISDSAKTMDIPIEGYVSDEEGDGKLGLGGRVVSMQNKFLESALWLGIVEGLTNIGKQGSVQYVTNTNGGNSNTVPIPSAGKEFQVGFTDSIQKSMGTIQKFVMENVKSIEPVIEIKGGRLVTFTLSKGIYIYPRISG